MKCYGLQKSFEDIYLKGFWVFLVLRGFYQWCPEWITIIGKALIP